MSYLGHVFSGSGMSPYPQKVQAVQEWPTPMDVTTVHQFLGLASYYQTIRPSISDIAAPLNAITQKGVVLAWTSYCADAFATIKKHLQAPVMSYLCFDRAAKEFTLQMDAGAVEIGAVLKQDGHVIAYASQSLTAPE